METPLRRDGPGGIPQLSVLGEALLKDTVLLGAPS
jgi:hypothetical protein